MKYIFWNVQKIKDANIYLRKLIEFYRPDIVGLAEYAANGSDLTDALKSNGLCYAYSPKIGSRVDLFYRQDKVRIVHCGESTYFSVKVITYMGMKQIVAVVHMPSKLYKSDYDDIECLRELLDAIGKVKRERGIEHVIIMGDFNMNPFEGPMIAASALQAVPSGEIAKKGFRNYHDKKREFYYNPMWNFLGDEKRPMGSYYYDSPGNEALYWNTFDQFVVSPSLVDEVKKDKIQFVNCFDEVVLENRNGKPKVSDHFPLYFEIGGR